MAWLPQSEELFQPQSVNKADYQFKYLAKEQPIKPKDEIVKAEGKFEGSASSHSDYKPWQVQPRYKAEQAQYKPPEGTMDLRTSYADEFVNGNNYVKLPPIKPQQQPEPNKPFEGKTESTDSFPQYRRAQLSQAKQQSCKPQMHWQAPTQAFESRSSYNGDFQQATGLKAQPVRPVGELHLSKDPMESTTTSKGAYSPTKAERRQPIVPRGELQLSTDTMQSLTTQRGDFSPRYQPRQQPIRQSGQLHLSNEPFMGKSVMQDEFVPRKGERAAAVRHQGEIQLSKEPMEVATTTRTIFTPKKRDGAPPRRRPLANDDTQRVANQVAVG